MCVIDSTTEYYLKLTQKQYMHPENFSPDRALLNCV